MREIQSAIRNVPNFPKPGVVFKDITPLLADAELFRTTIDAFAERLRDQRVDIIVGVEARGFVFASALAYALRAGTCMVRKPGKLPHDAFRQSYELEYGEDAVEIHRDAFAPGQRVVIIDDVLATGGTVAATLRLIKENFEVEIVEIDFLMELKFLHGRAKMGDHPVHTLLSY